jgi:hypothetical protein
MWQYGKAKDSNFSVKQNQIKSTGFPRLQYLSKRFRAPDKLGTVLRTLAYYARVPQPPRRPQDLEILMEISLAEVLAKRESQG